MSDLSEQQRAEQALAQRFGWTSLLIWAALGFCLEAAHGFKLDAYLGDELTRLLLRLGHAHGAGLSLVTLMYSVAAVPALPIEAGKTVWPGRLLRIANVLMPIGFTLSAFKHPEGDPSPAVLLVPIGALALLFGLASIAWSLHRTARSHRD